MTSPARVLQTNNDAIRRVQHLSEAAVLLWPDAPDLAQYYLFRMQQAAEKDNLKIPHRTASKICPSCGGLTTSKLRLVSAKRRTRRSAQLAARENKPTMNAMAPDAPPTTRPRNVLEQHCARCDHRRLFLAFQHAPVIATPVTVTPVKHAPAIEAATARAVPQGASHQPRTAINSTQGGHINPVKSATTHTNAAAGNSSALTKAAQSNKPSTGPHTKATPSQAPHKAQSNKHSMKSQVAKMLHETKATHNKKKGVQAGLKNFLDSINM